MHKNAFQEEYYFIPVDDIIIELAKKHRTNGCIAEQVITIHQYYLSSSGDESLNEFLNYYLSYWQLTCSTGSPCGSDFSCPIYYLYAQCKYVIHYIIKKGILIILDGLDFRQLRWAGRDLVIATVDVIDLIICDTI